MRIPDLVAAAAIAGFGVFLIREGRDLGLGEANEPGSGFMFWWIGVSMLLAAAALALLGMVRSTSPSIAEPSSQKSQLLLPLAGVVALALYALLLQPLGFIPTSALLLTGLFAFIGGYRLPMALAMGCMAALVSWFIFVRLLSSNLPAGILAGTPLGS